MRLRALRRPQHREARTTRFHVRIDVVRRRDQITLQLRHGHRIPASRVVTIARNAPLIEAGCVHDPRFLQKRKRNFSPQLPCAPVAIELSTEMNFSTRRFFRLSWHCHVARSRENRMVICPTGSRPFSESAVVMR
jgi:hypothetical protein